MAGITGAHLPVAHLQAETVLTAVRLVADDDDIAPRVQHREALLAVIEAKLLHGGEKHPARRARRQRPAQILAAVRLHRRLLEQILPGGKRLKQLAIQIAAVGDDHQRRMLQRRLRQQLARIKQHRNRLA